MNSCLYRCEVLHHRLTPREHRFRYNVFMFYIDLDELDMLSKRFRLFSRDTFNWFTFKDHDHLQYPLGEGHNSKTVKENITGFLASHDIMVDGKVMLLTNVSTLGYNFNPISFYLCFDKSGNPICSVAEVCNTHGEMKLYILDQQTFAGGMFRRQVVKNFYVSPFTDLESSFDFIFGVPSDKLLMRVDDYEQNKRFLLTSLSGTKKEFSDANLFIYGLRFPFITLQIMGKIFWQAFLLKLKNIPFTRKNFNLHLQQEKYSYKKA